MVSAGRESRQSGRSIAGSLLSLTVGVVLALWAVWWSGIADAGSLSEAPVPFGHAEVATVQVLATLPLAWLLATVWSGAMPGISRSALALGCAVLGTAVAFGYSQVGAGLVSAVSEVMPLVLLRPLCGLLLIGPWALAAMIWSPREPVSRWDLGVAALVAVVLPAIHAVHVAREERSRVTAALELGLTSQAWLGVNRLVGLAPRFEIAGSTPQELRRKLAVEIREHHLATETPLAAEASPGVRRQRAAHWIALGDWEQAHQTLAELTTDPEAALMQASIAEQQHDWEAATQFSAAAIRRLDALVAAGQGTVADLAINYSQVYERWSRNLRRRNLPLEAERLLLDALATRPELAGHLHYQLGVHYREGGRSIEAVRHLRRAAELDPSYGPTVAKAIRSLRTETPACFLGRWQRGSLDDPTSRAQQLLTR